MATTPHIGAILLESSQAQKEITVNMALMRFDVLINSGAISRSLAAPPVSPVVGDVYIVAVGASGDWSGKDGHVAYFDQVWRFIVPNEGLSLWVNDEDCHVYFDGASWIVGEGRFIVLVSGSAYSLQASDIGKIIELSHASAIMLTLPDDLPKGFSCQIVQKGAGQVHFSASGGATLRQRQNHTKTAGQYALCVLFVLENAGGASAEFLLSGDSAL